MSSGTDGPGVLVVGGTGGLLGRALLPELLPHYRIRSLHRHANLLEKSAGIEWVPADVTTLDDWRPALAGIDRVVNVAWYRWGPPSLFEAHFHGLERLLVAAKEQGVARFVHVSVPAAPPSLESGLPYLAFKRRFDAALAKSGLSYRTLRSTAMFGDGDVLLGVMMRSIERYPYFPMFGDGDYHLSPVAAADVAHAIRLELNRTDRGTVDLGGPLRFRYRDLTDLMFQLLHKRPRYWGLTPRGSLRLARWLQRLGSTLLYAYEVEWLMADLLGLAPYTGLDRPLTPVEPYLEGVARQLRPPARA